MGWTQPDPAPKRRIPVVEGILVVAILAVVWWGLPLFGGLFAPRASAPAPAAIATPRPTPVPTPTPRLGIIDFGTAWDENAVAITAPANTFPRTSKAIAFVAQFSEAPGATSVTVFLTRKSGAGEQTIHQEEIPIANPRFTVLGNQLDLAALAGRVPGTYVLRFVSGSRILAEGTFTLE